MPATHSTLAPHESTLERALLRLVDGAIAGVVFVMPLFMGGWHPVGHLVYVSLVATAAAAWCLRQAVEPRVRWRFSGLEAVLVAGAAILALQVATLPPDVVARLSPLSTELLPMWFADASASASSGAGLGPWTHISLMPEATRRWLVLWGAHAGLFLVVVQRVQTAGDVDRLLRWIAAAAIGMATIGLAQFLVGNGKFLWMYEHPYTSASRPVKGTFSNANHFAHFMALGIGPLLWWLASLGTPPASGESSASRRTAGTLQRPAWGRGAAERQAQDRIVRVRLAVYFGLGMVTFAGLLTFSRGGVLMLFLATAMAVLLLARYGAFGRRALAGLGAAAVVVAAAIFIYGYEPLADEMATLGGGTPQAAHANAARLRVWEADLQAFRLAPLLGTGAGTHAEVYPVFFPHYAPVEYVQAESGYVQVLLETGVAGGAVVLFLWAFALRWTIGVLRGGANVRLRLCAAAVTSGLAVSLVHSAWDFVWLTPACMAVAVVLAACGCRLWQMERAAVQDHASAPAAASRFSWAVAALVAVGLGVLMFHNRLGPALAASGWERFLALQQAERELEQDASPEALSRPLADSLRHDPQHARAHLRMAAVYVRKFEEAQQQSDVPMPLSQIRDAARASQFASRVEQDQWLTRVMGENRRWLDAALLHARRAVALCPLQGEAYTLLAELSFLDGPAAPHHAALLNQALRVRPYEAHVLFAAGRDAALGGQFEQALALWKTAFHHDPRYRRLIIAAVAPHVPAQQMLDHFQPDLDETRDIYRFYADAGLQHDAAVIAHRLAAHLEQDAAAKDGAAAARVWHEAHGLHQFLGEDGRALACVRLAAEAAPLEYRYLRDLAAQLLRAGEYQEAVEVIRWCRQRRRDDPQLERLWETAKRGPPLREPGDASVR